MSVETFTDGLEPESPEAVVWRFMEFWKLDDLMRTSTLYFCRADLFDDESEGLPPEQYIPLLVPAPVDALGVDDAIGSLAQFREAFFINCWYLFCDETLATVRMWKKCGEVAVCSRYSLLKSALDSLDSSSGRPHLGRVRYGWKHLTGWNAQRFITTKQAKYQDEEEVRALLWLPEQSTITGVNRHFDKDNKPHRRPLTPSSAPTCQRRKVDLQALITGIVVSPLAPDPLRSEVESLNQQTGHSIPVRPSQLAQYRHLLA
jgi:hypothetical protein